MSDMDELLVAIDERQHELLELLGTLVAYETPAPPARNTAGLQAFVEQYLQGIGFETEHWDVYPGDPNVVGVKMGTHSGEYRSLIINGHIDVAEVNEGEQWDNNPFSMVVKDGLVIGRGVADMKGGIAGALFALKLLHEHGLPLLGDVIFQSVVGEEVGEAGTLQCCNKGYTADLAIVVDTSDLHLQGQGGVITGWITVKSEQTFHDGNRRDLIHAGGNLVGASAIEKMMKIVQALQELERHYAVTKSYPGCKPGSNTINPSVIEGGRHAAFIADECKLWITVHYYPNETHEQVAREIEEYVLGVARADIWMKDHLPTFEWGGTSMIEERGEIFPALELDSKHPGVQRLAELHGEISGEDAILDVSQTVTDGGWFGHAGIPAVIYGPGELKHAHAVNERLSIDQLVTYTKVILAMIHDWTSAQKESA
ncbi:acetylornithine deacetylase [Paenibacillus senegalimassiliensis]|uniref:acetylornithine deacetylase n=1 Tax=Paenibacillus senegalimassiliensis TaxID=1737426 RepID=UPI00073F9246|nr:acetylornithine deacetylase [Paenibacillus senegalimassiliensis]